MSPRRRSTSRCSTSCASSPATNTPTSRGRSPTTRGSRSPSNKLGRELAQGLFVVSALDSRAKQGKLLQGLRARCGIVPGICGHEALQLRDLIERLDLRRHEAAIFQNAVGDAQVLGHQGIVVQGERPALAGKLVELAARNGFGDPLFCEKIEHQHGLESLSYCPNRR